MTLACARPSGRSEAKMRRAEMPQAPTSWVRLPHRSAGADMPMIFFAATLLAASAFAAADVLAAVRECPVAASADGAGTVVESTAAAAARPVSIETGARFKRVTPWGKVVGRETHTSQDRRSPARSAIRPAAATHSGRLEPEGHLLVGHACDDSFGGGSACGRTP